MTPRVRIVPDTNQKYVLVRIHDGTEEYDLLWGDPDAEWHNDIVEAVRATGVRIRVVYGGGRIEQRTDKKAIYAWDRSTRYGSADAAIVEAVLTEAYPDHTLHMGAKPL